MEPIPHSRASLPTTAEWVEVTGRLSPGWVADGPCTAEFAAAAAAWLGGAAGVAVNSGTSALHLALLAVGVRPGSEVLVPAYCCTALLNAVHQAGALPVLVDCQPASFHPCPRDAARRITPRTSAVVVAHLFGEAIDVDPFLQLAMPVVEDCAQALGARHRGRPAGGHGAAAVTSFYATKLLTTGHGGLVASRCAEVAAVAADRLEYEQREEWLPGFNYRMSELQAALGLWQLERYPGYLQRRRKLAAWYDRELLPAACEAWSPLPTAAAPDAVRYRYLLTVPDADRALAELAGAGIGAKRPVHRPMHHYLGGDYPHAEWVHRHLVSLPLYPALTDAEAERVVEAVLGLGREVG